VAAKADPMAIDTVWTQIFGPSNQVQDLNISPDGQYIYAGIEGFHPRKLSVETGEVLMEYEGMKPLSDHSPYYLVEMSKNGSTLYAAHIEEFVYSWDTQTGEMLGTFDPDIEQIGYLAYQSLSVSENYIAGLMIYKLDQHDFYTITKLVIWDRNTREIVHSEINSAIEEIEFSNSGDILVYQYNEKKGGEIGLINTMDWSTIYEFPGHANFDSYDVAFSPDDSKLATCGYDRKINIYDVNSKLKINEIPYPEDGITDIPNVIFSDDSKYLITTDDNSITYKVSLKIFETEHYDFQREFNYFTENFQFAAVRCIDVKKTNGENIIFTGHANGLIKLKVDEISYINSIGKQSNNIIIPNPNNSTAYIELTIEKPESIEISIINSAGIEIEEIHSGVLNQGEHNFIWNGGNFPSGVYYCRIIGKDLNKTLKIILEK
jgi:WD40 repeat protein